MDRPNILFILTDQQSANMMSCTGNRYLYTPAMDKLASRGVRFERVYCTNPICVPSRFSLMTGKFPSEVGLRGNDAKKEEIVIPQYIKDQGMGWLFKNAGYEAVYGGKQHLPNLNAEELGFDVISSDERDALADTCANYVKKKRSKPFFLVASFINPHDICLMAIRDHYKDGDIEKLPLEIFTKEIETLDKALKLPENISDDQFFGELCPPLPDNFEIQQDEPEAVRIHQSARPFKARARRLYTDRQWRMHRWAYCRLTELVDRQIAKIMDSLEKSGNLENTVVIFTSDHGDMDSSHRMEHKELLYEEACRVPLIMSWPGGILAGKTDHRHLISNGLDIIKTIYDYAGIPAPEELKGNSLKALAEKSSITAWRSVLPIEGEYGRAIITDAFKYVLYDQGENREQLYDMEKHPGEMINIAFLEEYKDTLEAHRQLFRHTFPQG